MLAPKAPMLILVFAETKNEEGNNIRTGLFDTGAAWMSLALQANRMGLNSRAMGGIDLEAAYVVAGVPKDRFTAICAIAVGYRGTDEDIHPRMVVTILPMIVRNFLKLPLKSSFNPEELQKSNYDSKPLSS